MKSLFFSIFLVAVFLLPYDIVCMKRSLSDVSINKGIVASIVSKKRKTSSVNQEKKNNEFPLLLVSVNSNEDLKKFAYWSGKIYAYPNPTSFGFVKELDPNLFTYVVNNTYEINKKMAGKKSSFEFHSILVNELLKEIPQCAEIVKNSI